MSKDKDNPNPNTSGDEQRPDVTVDLDALSSQEPADQNDSSQASNSGENVTSIEISDINQTMDLTPSSRSLGSGTIDIDEAVDHTMDLSGQDSIALDGTRIVSPSIEPFQGKVFGQKANDDLQEGTRILSPSEDPNAHTMEIADSSSLGSGSSISGASAAHDGTMLLSDSQPGSQGSSVSGLSMADDGTMLLSDSQQGSQGGSSSVAGKSSYDQTMELSDSALESKGGSDARSIAGSIRTGQSVPGTGKSNFKSVADSRQYLQADRAKASDAFLDRVTERKISYTLDWNDVTSDYQINKRIDPKSGKLELHVLGKGGMGLVYLATQNSVNRAVALKVIRKDKQTDAFSKQFFYEAEITAQLEHPNITPIYELGRTPDGTFFYSMKYIQGTPWEKKIRENSIEENLDIFGKLCDAIAFAHSKNIVHMDIKPDNVQLGEFGEVYAVDWGVASNLKRPESIRCAGTWQWISPEVSRGERDKIGKGSDIYLLGGILYLIVTGHHPRLPKDPAVKMGQSGLTKAAQNNIIQPTDCTDPMLAVALKAMESEPSDRYARVEDLQDAIEKIQKERANIKSSQELTDRSLVLASEAQKQGDYDRFNRSIFGLQDAIELWRNNPKASEEIKKVRLAYGNCAYEKGDYDLALQTLDRNESQENSLYEKAEKARTVVKQRASRIWWLSRIFVASLIVGTGVVGSLWFQAEKAREREEIAKADAIDQKKNAEDNAEKAKREELKAKDAETAALKAKADEEQAKLLAQENEKKAVDAKESEEKAKNSAIAARRKAEEQLAKTQLTEIASQLGLARSRINEANPTGAEGLLGSITEEIRRWTSQRKESIEKSDDQSKDSIQANALITNLPNPDNWAKNRIALLTNSDIAGVDLRTQANFKSGRSAFAIDPKDSSLIVANPTGEIYRIDLSTKESKRIWIPSEDSGWGVVKAIRSVVPSSRGNRLYLALDREKDPVMVLDLEDGKLAAFDKEIPNVGDQIALSPVARHIATTQSGYLWITRNSPGSKGNAIPTKDQAIQIQWLSDELLLALIQNRGGYHLQLIAPFVGTADKDNRSSYVQYTASLAEDIVRFGLIQKELPQVIAEFKSESLLELETSNGKKLGAQQEVLASLIESLQLVVGQSNGKLTQTRLKRTDSQSSPSTSLWTLADQFPLATKHLHAIEDIVIEQATQGSTANRRIITRAASEQAVQVWNLTQQATDVAGSDRLVISHLHSLTGSPLKDESGLTGIAFSGFTQDGQVILVNSDFVAHRLDIDEQIERGRVAYEIPFTANAFEESTAKWLFNRPADGHVVSVDGYGAMALYGSNSKDLQTNGKRIGFAPQTNSLRFQQYPNLQEIAPRGQVKIAQANDFQYWGHSPFAEIVHFAFAPDGKTAISLATIPGSKAVYLLPRNTNLRAETLEFKEVCYWDLHSGQMLDRIVFQSESSVDRLSVLDDHRFLFGNTETLTIIDRLSTSVVSAEMAKTAVHFCVANPTLPYHAFFRADGNKGTCWIGNIPSEKSGSNSGPKWISNDDNRMALLDSAPVGGCWSNDGTRLYVLDSKSQIRRFDFNPTTGMLSASVGQNSNDLLKPDNSVADLMDSLIIRPERLLITMANSNSSPNGWTDEILIAPIHLNGSAIDSKESKQNARAIFSRDNMPQWKSDSELHQKQKDYQALTDRLLQIAKTTQVITKIGNQLRVGHEPLHATSDASGNIVVMHYPTAILLLTLKDSNVASWYRLEQTLDSLKRFDLSPDGSTLATVDGRGLHLFKLVTSNEKTNLTLEPLASGLADESSVVDFAWDSEPSSNPSESPLRFAYVLKDRSIGYASGNAIQELGKLCDASTEEMIAGGQQFHKIEASEIRDIWFFKEVLSDQTQNPNLKTTLRYLAIQYQYEDKPVESSKDLTAQERKPIKKVRFILLPGSDAQAQNPNQRICTDLDIGQSFTKVAPNPKGGILVTGDELGNVVVYFVSPYWGISNPVFDANNAADSAIECLGFAESGNTLLISNTNNHLFGLRTKPNSELANK